MGASVNNYSRPFSLKKYTGSFVWPLQTGNGVNAWRPSHLSGKTVIKVPGLKIV
jgi:hypothetical protein